MEPQSVDLGFVATVMAWALALVALIFVVSLAWRRFGPTRRHRRHHSRTRRLAGKE